MPKRLLYPASFIRTVPPPERWDRRPLSNLLYKSQHREDEISRLEAWYRELRSGQKTDLKKRLRSLSVRDFWSGYHELMTARIANGLGAVSVRHAAFLQGGRPDLAVTFPGRTKHIWEVASTFQTTERESDDNKAHELANRLNREFQHRWRVILDATQFSAGGLSLKQAKPRIRSWLDRLEHGGPKKLTLKPPAIDCHLTLTASPSPHRDQPGPIVQGLMGQGGKLTATDRIRGILRKKIKKYDAVKHARLPFVIFLYEGDWLHISRDSLEWALQGQLQAIFNRNTGQVTWAVEEGGLFMTWSDGRPRNTRLSAVVYCKRVWHDDAVHASMFVYHHPAAQLPISDNIFRGYPQCHMMVRKTELRATWDHNPGSHIQMLRLG